jgi:MFS family permease
MKSTEASQPVLSVLSHPRVIIALLTATMGAYSIGTVEATLSPYLEHMGLDVKLIAIAFLVMSLCSVVATPVFGWMCDGKVSPWLVSCCGCVFMFICFAFLGPVPYLTFFHPNLYTVCGSLVAQGFGCAAVLVASFGSAQLAAVTAGLPDSLELQSVVSGLFTSSFAMGNFCGPTVSGILYDAVGFNYNCLILQALVFIVFLFNIISFMLTRTSKTPSKLDTEAVTTISKHLTDRPDLIADLKTQWDAVDHSRQI